MGSNESKPRNIVIDEHGVSEYDFNNEKSFSSKRSNTINGNTKMIYSQDDINLIASKYEQKLQNYKNMKSKNCPHRIEDLAEAVKDVEMKYMQLQESSLCNELRSELTACFLVNGHEILRCSESIQRFQHCLLQYQNIVS